MEDWCLSCRSRATATKLVALRGRPAPSEMDDAAVAAELDGAADCAALWYELPREMVGADGRLTRSENRSESTDNGRARAEPDALALAEGAAAVRIAWLGPPACSWSMLQQ